MRLTVSQARSRLGRLVTLAQDPRDEIVITRHGRALAALVSMRELSLIREIEDQEKFGATDPVAGGYALPRLPHPEGLVYGPDGKFITKREAAQIVRTTQMNRAEERRVLAEGRMKPVEGGELTLTMREAVPVPVPVPAPAPARRRWWPFGR